MHRFFVDNIASGAARITGEDVRHISRVLRLRAGDAITLCDGEGTDYDAVIAAVSDSAVECRVGVGRPSRTEPPCRVTVYQCLPKAGKLETIVQKCTELGASAFVPVVSQRCVAQPTEHFESKLARYRRVALEAGKQCRRGRIPTFDAPVPIESVNPAQFDLFLLAYEEERAQSLKSVLRQSGCPGSIAVLIGPEGGFAASEVSALTARGAIPVSLGARILRTETAGMAMLAQILYEAEP